MDELNIQMADRSQEAAEACNLPLVEDAPAIVATLPEDTEVEAVMFVQTADEVGDEAEQLT